MRAPPINAPMPGHDNAHANQPFLGTYTGHLNNTIGTFRKSCQRCYVRKMKCVIVEGSNPKVCTEYHKKGLACVFEEKKTYSRKSATSAQCICQRLDETWLIFLLLRLNKYISTFGNLSSSSIVVKHASCAN